MKSTVPIIVCLLILALILVWIFAINRDDQSTRLGGWPPSAKEMELSDVNLPSRPVEFGLKHPPKRQVADWAKLEAYQETLSAEELTTLLEEVYAVGDTWKQVIKIEDDTATITTTETGEPFVLKLRPAEKPSPESVPRYWQEGPLDTLHIAIDPGHIGGDFSFIERRQFGFIEDKPVREGEMALITAQLLKPKLEALGAKVTLVRDKNEPVTSKRAKDFLAQYKELNPNWPEALLKVEAQKRFYRREEIVERARLVNEVIKPDLILCLHYNASASSGEWLDPTKPTLVDENHFHILLNGAYTRGEVLSEGDRFQMMERILQRIHRREVELAKVIADVFVEHTGLPAYSYHPRSSRAKNVGPHPYLWARNLLANRSYTCPVIYYEPWCMNNKEVYLRAQAGHYEGTKNVAGKDRPSIMSEYAEAVAAGIAKYYSQLESE